MTTRYIRLLPGDCHELCDVRLELYGCSQGTSHRRLLTELIIFNMPVFSNLSYNRVTHIFFSDCNLNPGNSYLEECIGRGDTYEHDLRGLYHLTSMLTKGRSGGARMNNFRIQYRPNIRRITPWQYYMLDNSIVV